jgi:hypothetical protein
MRLTCKDGAAGRGFSGTIRFRTPLADEPLPLPATEAAIKTVARAEYQIDLAARSGEASILFPVDDKPNEVTVVWRRDDGRDERNTFPVPTPGEVRWLAERDSSGARCRLWVPKEGLRARKEKRQLTESEIERLRALGYME